MNGQELGYPNRPGPGNGRCSLESKYFLFPFSDQRDKRQVHGVVRQSKRGSASQSHSVAWQVVEIRALSSVEIAHGMTNKG